MPIGWRSVHAGVVVSPQSEFNGPLYPRYLLNRIVLFGWDTGLIGGVLPRSSFKHSFGLDTRPADFANLSGWSKRIASCSLISLLIICRCSLSRLGAPSRLLFWSYVSRFRLRA